MDSWYKPLSWNFKPLIKGFKPLIRGLSGSTSNTLIRTKSIPWWSLQEKLEELPTDCSLKCVPLLEFNTDVLSEGFNNDINGQHEKAMEKLFGQEFKNYKKTTRRWL